MSVALYHYRGPLNFSYCQVQGIFLDFHAHIIAVESISLYHRTKKSIKMLCLKQKNLQKRNTQNLNLKEENSSCFYSWGLQWTVVKKFV